MTTSHSPACGVGPSPHPPSSRQVLIRSEGVQKVYGSASGNVIALENIDLTVLESEFVSILGPSGCGKSTLLRCIGGLEAVTKGRIEIQDKEVDEPPDAGFVFQRDVLLDWRTVIENVLLPAEFRRLKRSEWEPRALQLLKTLGLEGCARRYPWELSGGMRQRVAICRGLLLDPSLILMDEPFGALDAITRDELNLELSRIWQASRKTVLFVTHSISEAVFLSSRVIVMNKNPGRTEAILDIDLPFPRTLAVRETPEFTEYVRRLRSIFERMGFMQ